MMMGGFPYSSLMKFKIFLNPKGEIFSQPDPVSSQVRSTTVPALLRGLVRSIRSTRKRMYKAQSQTEWQPSIITRCHCVGLPISCTSLPICIIMLKPFVVHRKCKDSGVMVKSKIIIGTVDPLYFLRSELWQPAEIYFLFVLLLNHECSWEMYYTMFWMFFFSSKSSF